MRRHRDGPWLVETKSTVNVIGMSVSSANRRKWAGSPHRQGTNIIFREEGTRLVIAASLLLSGGQHGVGDVIGARSQMNGWPALGGKQRVQHVQRELIAEGLSAPLQPRHDLGIHGSAVGRGCFLDLVTEAVGEADDVFV